MSSSCDGDSAVAINGFNDDDDDSFAGLLDRDEDKLGFDDNEDVVVQAMNNKWVQVDFSSWRRESVDSASV